MRELPGYDDTAVQTDLSGIARGELAVNLLALPRILVVVGAPRRC